MNRSKRACDACRTRRVKCNGHLPCDRCLTSGIECAFASPVIPKGPKTGRVITSLRSQSTSTALAPLEDRYDPSSPGSSRTPLLRPAQHIEQPSHACARLLDRYDRIIMLAVRFFFDRLYDLNPTLDRQSTLARLTMKEHLYDPPLASLALAITSIVRMIPEASDIEEHLVDEDSEWKSSSTMLQDAMKLHNSLQLGQHPDLDSVATSMMIGSVLMAQGASGAAYLRYKEAVGLAELLHLDKASTFDTMGQDRPRALRLTSILSSAGRMCSLAQGRQFDWKIIPTALLREGDYLSEHICRLRGITHLFELIDNDLLDCINGSCGGAKGCSSNPSKILATLASLEIVDPNDLHHEAERVDILITKRWLQSKIWLVCVTHGLLVVPQIIPELGLEYPLDLLQHAVTALSQNPVSAFEANGKAMSVKLKDIAFAASVVLTLPNVELLSSRMQLEELQDMVQTVRAKAKYFEQIMWIRCDKTTRIYGPVLPAD